MGYIAFEVIQVKLFKYVVTPIIAFVYGLVLLIMGMGVGDLYFVILAILPVIIGVLLLLKRIWIKRS